MGENLDNRYRVTPKGDVYRINDDGSFTDLGNAEKGSGKAQAQHASQSSLNNYLIPIMQRHWAYHGAKPNWVVCTIFDGSGGACQLLSNKTDQLLLEIALTTPEDKEKFYYRFKNHRYCSLFENDGDDEIFNLELGGITDWSIQVTTEILTDVFEISVFREIPVEFETWESPNDGAKIQNNECKVERHEVQPQSQPQTSYVRAQPSQKKVKTKEEDGASSLPWWLIIIMIIGGIWLMIQTWI